MKLTGSIKKGLLLLFLISGVMLAGGTNRLSLFGAKTTALNGMYFAGIDGVSNIYLNPAGLAGLSGIGADVSCFFIQEEQVFDSKLKGLHKSILEGDPNFGGGIYWSVSPGFTVGFAYQYATDYRVSWPYVLLYQLGNSTATVATDLLDEQMYRIYSPSVSYKFNSVSVGLTANVYNINSKKSFAQNNYAWTGSNGMPAYQFDYLQNAWAVNFNLGVMLQVDDNLILGLTANNGIDKTIEGRGITSLYELTDSVKTTSNMESQFQIPWKFGLGCLYKFDEQISINLDFRYNLYGSLDEKIIYKFDDAVWQRNVQIPDSVTGISAAAQSLYLQNSFDAGIGLEYKASPDVNIYLGYRFSQTPNSEKSFNMLNPTVSHHSFSCGFGYSDSEVTIEGSVAYYLGVEKSIAGSALEVNDGNYNASGVIPTLTFKFKL